MREYSIREFTRWEDVPVAPIDNRLWCPPVDIEARAQAAWDEGGIRVRMTAREARIRAEHKTPLGMPCEDSCLEFFLAPMAGDERYINIEYNPNGCVYLGLGGQGELIRLLPERDWLTPEPFFTPDGWGIEYRVPWRFLRLLFPDFSHRPGTVMRGNFFKCGDKTETEHYFSWNPVTSPTPDFHRPCDFGRVVIV